MSPTGAEAPSDAPFISELHLANLLMKRVSFSLRLINFHSDFVFFFR